ncbi:MAG: hypothetical protein K0S28_273 [Paucimonas sp.]|jgi:hypothetical protein|nr:hypothetical protein [Paucimonas sp.]
MYMVYWMEANGDEAHPHARPFNTDELSAALSFTEVLRQRQRAGESVSFVTMCAENPHSVGAPGVADPPADYAWKKRRP